MTHQDNSLSIVMYHYVRPIKDSKFPQLKGLELEKFRRQLDYLDANFVIVDTEDVIRSVKSKSPLPKNACWLTFDDGYQDHYEFVLPELLSRGLTAAFFPPKHAVFGSKLLDVNAIQHILSSVDSVNELRVDLEQTCLCKGVTEKQLKTLRLEHLRPNRFDDADTNYIKRLLQHALPENDRREITSALFESYVGIGELEFAQSLYISVSQAKSLVSSGMYVGSHGSAHYWLNRVPASKQRRDIEESLEFLEEIGAATSDWIMCYPYGAYNSTTLRLLGELGAVAGVTTETKTAMIGKDNPLTLPRFDTNDFPQ